MRSWNNDLFYFDTKTSKYFKIRDVGSRPSPRAAFGYAQTENVGYIFGGRCASGRQNDFHRFDFETRTWTFLKPCGPERTNLPCGRSWLSLIYNDNSVLVYGGLDKHDRKGLINDGKNSVTVQHGVQQVVVQPKRMSPRTEH